MEISPTLREWQQTATDLAVPPNVKLILDTALGELEEHHFPTAEHCRRVGTLGVRIALHEDLPPKPVFYGGSLHDWGKLLVPEPLLSKTDTWTPGDAKQLRPHPVNGYQMALDAGLIVTGGLIARHHTFQPEGYPEAPPNPPPYMTASFQRCARVIALADYYDAAHRPNSAGLSSGEEIQTKVLAHNPDVETLVHELYEAGIFSIDR